MVNDLVPYVETISSHEAGLSAKQRDELRLIEARIKHRMKGMTRDLIEIGIDMLDAKDMLGHGPFLVWRKKNFGVEDRTAQRYMAVATRFEKHLDMVTHLPISLLYTVVQGNNWAVMKDGLLPAFAEGRFITEEEVRARIPAKTAPTKKQAQPITLASPNDSGIASVETVSAELDSNECDALDEIAFLIKQSRSSSIDIVVGMDAAKVGEMLIERLLSA